MKRLEELGISPAPWSAGTNPAIATLLDGRVGKCIYANGDVNNTPYVGFANVVEGDTISAIRNARLFAAAPELYECLREAVVEMCHGHACCGEDYECNGVDRDCFVRRWRAALAKAAGEEAVK